ncbi:MAG: flavodoxin family protein [Synergistaceae bacterium]|nr:flavodoxin family protein [Synergistaceae bacterium]
MKVIAINGSPRKQWNTATLLQHAIDGAKSKGANTEIAHLYDLNYKGCVSCFACKTKGGASRGRCVVNDDLRPLFDKIEVADALILGSPIYIGAVTGEMRSFLERLVFQYLEYNTEHSSLFKGKLSTGWILTMNVPQEALDPAGYTTTFKAMESLMARVFGHCESLLATDTLQFNDYSQYETPMFDENKKRLRRKTIFPEDCRKAFELGARFAEWHERHKRK